MCLLSCCPLGHGGVDVVRMAFKKYEELQPGDAWPALVRHFPFVVCDDVSYLFKCSLVCLVRVLAGGDWSHYEHA